MEIDSQNSARITTLNQYVSRHSITPTEGVELCKDGTLFTVVIPAYNEERYIGATLNMLCKSQLPIEIVIVNNLSTDHTEQLLREYQLKYPTTITILECEMAGLGYTRKRGVDETIAQYLKNIELIGQRRYVALVDADTLIPDDWIYKNFILLEDQEISATSGFQSVPHWVDDRIADITGIQSLYGHIDKTLRFLLIHDCAYLLTAGPNTCIEIEAYAAIDGIKQLFDKDGNISKGEDWLVGNELRALGRKVVFNDSAVEASPRRILVNMLRIMQPDLFQHMVYSGITDMRWGEIRKRDDHELVEYVLSIATSEDWINEMKRRESFMLFYNIVLPILDGNLTITNLQKLLGTEDPLIVVLHQTIESTQITNHTQEEIYKIGRDIAETFSSHLIEKIRLIDR